MKSFSVFSIFTIAMMLCSATGYAEDTGEVVKYETGFYYTVKKGDTLWDISQHFSDSPWLWPDLWKENDQIPNPHWIYPGERIRLYLGKGKHTTDKSAVSDIPVAPPTEGVYYLYAGINQVGFIRKPAVPPSGTIFKVQDDKKMISIGDIVYIRPPEKGKSDLVPGSRFTIFRPIPPTEDKKSLETIGTQHYLLGILEITRNEADFAMATIVKSFRKIEVEDQLMPYENRSPEILIKESTPGIDGNVIVSEEHSDLIGAHQIVFIDKGRRDNIVAGQQYTAYYQEEQKLDPKSKDTVLLPPVDFGTLFVLHTEEETSTVLVSYSGKDLAPGTKFHTQAR